MPVNYREFDLKQLRKDTSMSQAELAEMLQVSRSRLSRIENYKERLSYVQASILIKRIKNISEYEIRKSDADVSGESVKQLRFTIDSLNEVIALKDEIINSKQEQIELLKSQNSIITTSNMGQPINLSVLNSKGDFVNWDLIDIPTDKYLEIKTGIFDRSLISSDHLINEEEDVFKDAISNIDFDKFRVLLNYSKQGTIFDTHYHAEPESIIVASGQIQETLSGTDLSYNEVIRFESMQPHRILNLTDTRLIILLEKL